MDDLSSRYTIKKKISSGGMATIFLAEDTSLHRDVAIKRVHPHLLERPEAIRRFNNEARIIASLSHENIITVFDYGESKDGHYIVMEYIDGFNTLELIEKFGTIPNIILLDIIMQILSGLKAAHDKGIYHRDIKPENIMIDKKGIVHIMDFGIAYLVNQESITLTGSFVGSPHYVSPEQITGKAITKKSDIFSFGCLCYVCATNQLPFDADNPNGIIHKVVNEEPVPPFICSNELLLTLSDFILMCLRKDTEKRPDVDTCILWIEDLCTTDTLIRDRERYDKFIMDPTKYRQQEREELFRTYQKNALMNYKNRKFVSALKNLNQMQSFGNLTKEDYKILNRIKNRRKIKKTFISVLVTILIICVWVIMKEYIRKENTVLSESAAVLPLRKNETDKEEAHGKRTPPDTFPKQNPTIPKVAMKQYGAENKRYQKTIKREPVSSEKVQDSILPINRHRHGYLSIRTNPPWTKVFIDGVPRGETPKTGIIQLKVGEHTMVLEKTGFYKEDLYFSIVASDTLKKKIKMKPLN